MFAMTHMQLGFDFMKTRNELKVKYGKKIVFFL